MIGGIFGARIFYVLMNFEEYVHDPIEILRIDHGGLVFYGGFFGAIVTAIGLTRKLELSLGSVADLFSLGLPLGQSIGRLGCFINGCCFGAPSNAWFGVQYPHDSAIWSTQVHQHLISPATPECLTVLPVQLVQSSINLTIWGLLLIMASRLPIKGQLFSLYLILYPVGRFFCRVLSGRLSSSLFGAYHFPDYLPSYNPYWNGSFYQIKA